VLCTY